jgi:hypothetical protein
MGNLASEALKPGCFLKTPERKIPRSIHEDARDVAQASRRHSRVRAVAQQSQAGRKTTS